MASAGGAGGLGEALRAAASPELYRHNAFRLAGLPVDATPAEVRRRADEVRSVRALGGAPSVTGVLPLDPVADAEHVEQALSRLREPMTAVVDGFFWFWPAGPDGDPDAGLVALAAGDVDRAESVWQAARSGVAQHNLAVLNHALALDDEHAGKPLPRVGAPLRWRRAYQHWLAVWQSDAFWDGYAERVARLDQPGFGPSTAPTFRQHLPLVLASVSAAVALRCVERGLPDEAAAVHWRLAGYQGFPAGPRAEAVRAATESIVARIDSRIEHAARTARQRPRVASAAASELHEQAGPLLRTLALSGAADADGMHDAVARQLLECASLHQQETNDPAGTLAVLRLAQQTARGQAVIGQLRENVIAVERAVARTRRTPSTRPRGPRFEVQTMDDDSPEARRIRDALQAALDDYQGRRERGELTKDELERERQSDNDLIPETTLVELTNKFSKERQTQRLQDAVQLALEDYQRRQQRGELTEKELDRQRRSGNDTVPPVETLVELANEILQRDDEQQ